MSDYINRRAAIEAIKEFKHEAAKWRDEQEERSEIWHRADSAIASALEIGIRVKKLPSAQQWIPCSERFPQENETVLISAKYIGHLSQNDPYVEEGFLTHDGWYSAYGDNYSELLAKVVAWMPLPKPYKGEES